MRALPACVAVAVLAAGLMAVPARAQNILVVPFENASGDARLDWIGEGLAELSVERLAGDTRVVFTRDDRLAAVEKMGLPSSSRFSRATLLKIAEEIDADYTVFGSYGWDGRTLTATARVLRSDPPDLSPPLVESGSKDDLHEVHARLAWRILNVADSALPFTLEQFLGGLERPRLDAFEQYIRGLMSANEERRLRHLREAARLAPEWSAPPRVLGTDAFARRDCIAALNWLSRIAPEQRGFLEASFYSGLCHLQRNEWARAEGAWARVSQQARPAEVWNNLGVARARQDKWHEAAAAWQHAQALDPAEPDYGFNLGLAALRNQDPATAVRFFRETLRRKPDDAEARGALVTALERGGRLTEAAAERAALPGAVAPPALRAKTALNGSGLASGRRPTARHRAAHLQLHLARGRDFLATGKLAEAQREFSEAVFLAPESAEAHVALADIHERAGRLDDAIRECRAALWSRDDANLRVRLARIYMGRNLASEARAELRAAIKLEPEHAEARRLLGVLNEAASSGGKR